MINTSRCKEKSGRLGRRRSYRCIKCGRKYRTGFRFTPLPKSERVCDDCKSFTTEPGKAAIASSFQSAGVAGHHPGTD